MKKTKIFKELILLKKNSIRKFSIGKLLLIASYEELENGFYSSATNASIDKFIKFLSYILRTFGIEF